MIHTESENVGGYNFFKVVVSSAHHIVSGAKEQTSHKHICSREVHSSGSVADTKKTWAYRSRAGQAHGFLKDAAWV